MGNHIFKDLSASKTIQTMAFDPPGVKFLHNLPVVLDQMMDLVSTTATIHAAETIPN